MVYYHKLWAMMERKNITQKQLMERTGVSSATLTKMRKGEYVSLEVIDKIRAELGCGFGELLTSVPPRRINCRISFIPAKSMKMPMPLSVRHWSNI